MPTFRRSLAAALLALPVAWTDQSQASAQTQPRDATAPWIRFTPLMAGFSIELPHAAEPRMRRLASGLVTFEAVPAAGGSTPFKLNWLSLAPTIRDPDQSAAFLLQAARTVAGARGGGALTDIEGSVGPWPARCVSFQGADGIAQRWWVVAAFGMVYFFGASGIDDAEAARLAASFRIEDPRSAGHRPLSCGAGPSRDERDPDVHWRLQNFAVPEDGYRLMLPSNAAKLPPSRTEAGIERAVRGGDRRETYLAAVIELDPQWRASRGNPEILRWALESMVSAAEPAQITYSVELGMGPEKNPGRVVHLRDSRGRMWFGSFEVVGNRLHRVEAVVDVELALRSAGHVVPVFVMDSMRIPP